METTNGNGAPIDRKAILWDLLKRALFPTTIASAIIILLYKQGAPKTPEDFIRLLALASFGLLVWIVQIQFLNNQRDESDRHREIVKTQEKIATVLENHLGSVEQSLVLILSDQKVMQGKMLDAIIAAAKGTKEEPAKGNKEEPSEHA